MIEKVYTIRNKKLKRIWHYDQSIGAYNQNALYRNIYISEECDAAADCDEMHNKIKDLNGKIECIVVDIHTLLNIYAYIHWYIYRPSEYRVCLYPSDVVKSVRSRGNMISNYFGCNFSIIVSDEPMRAYPRWSE